MLDKLVGSMNDGEEGLVIFGRHHSSSSMGFTINIDSVANGRQHFFRSVSAESRDGHNKSWHISMVPPTASDDDFQTQLTVPSTWIGTN